MISIVLLSYLSEKKLTTTVSAVFDKMQEENIDFELIIVDDGSTDNSFQEAMDLQERYTNVRAYQLSKNYTSPYVQFAGFQLAKGDCVVTIPDDLQRPLDVVVKMCRHWENGAKLVVAHHDKRDDGFFSDLFSNLYYKLMNRYSDINFPPGGADGFLADREIIDILNNKISPMNTTPLIEALRLGFDPVFFSYERPVSEDKSRWTFRKKVRLASDTFYSSSNFPVRLITAIGFTTSLFSFVLIVFIIFAKLFSSNTLFGFPIQGWATIVVLVSFFNGLVLFCMGIVAQYIWRIYNEVKGRPGFIIKNRKDDA